MPSVPLSFVLQPSLTIYCQFEAFGRGGERKEGAGEGDTHVFSLPVFKKAKYFPIYDYIIIVLAAHTVVAATYVL